MWWAIVKCVKLISLSVVFVFVFATSVHAWSADTEPNYHVKDAPGGASVPIDYPCAGTYSYVTIHQEKTVRACVMGANTRVAMYSLPQGGVAYAIGFPHEELFYRLDMCSGRWGCVYAGQTDTFIDGAQGYENFASHLTKTIVFGKIYYRLSEHSSTFPITRIAGTILIIQSIAVSDNGEWFAIQMVEYGTFRINARTHEIRRVIAPVNGGYEAAGARTDVAISNDGATVAVMGEQKGMMVVIVDAVCGEHPKEPFLRHASNGAVPCKQVLTQSSTYTEQFNYALAPSFNRDGSSLSFTAYSKVLAPRRVTLFSAAGSQFGETHYMAIGDSFTSGEGEITDTFYIGGPGNKCHVSTRSYPFLIARSWSVGVENVACSGATMNSAMGISKNGTQSNQVEKIKSKQPRITTIGIGGNDAGLVGKLKDCVGITTCEWAESEEARQKTALEIQRLYPRLRDFYQEVQNNTSDVAMVVGYPLIVSSQNGCPSPIGLLLNKTERMFMNETIRYLNSVIRRAARDIGLLFVDIEQAFSGSELCSSYTSSSMNAIRIGDEYPDIAELPNVKIIGAESFHPKPEGHVKISKKILRSYPRAETIVPCDDCEVMLVVPETDTYWGDLRLDGMMQQAVSSVSAAAISQGDTLTVSFPKHSFEPASSVVLELHSEVTQLGVYEVSADGSLNVTISTQDFPTGFHSVHAKGKSFTGKEVDLYDFVEIGEPKEEMSVARGGVALVSTQQPSPPGVLGALNMATLKQSITKPAASPGRVANRPTHTMPNLQWLVAAGIGAVLVLVAVGIYIMKRKTVALR